jgi:hypothetical protein
VIMPENGMSGQGTETPRLAALVKPQMEIVD